MWERFSYYGMRSLLVLYLTQHFLFSDDYAQGLYAAYASLVGCGWWTSRPWHSVDGRAAGHECDSLGWAAIVL